MKAVPGEPLLWRAANLVLVILAQPLVCWGTCLAGLSALYVPTVYPTVIAHGLIAESDPIDVAWFVSVAVTAIGMVACAGIPRPGAQGVPFGGVAGQAVGGFIAVSGAVVASVLEEMFTFAQEGSRCYYESCWPSLPQHVALAFPHVLAGTAMIVGAALARRLRWWVRALVPPLLWVTVLAIQQLVWRPWLLPLFSGPPP